MLNRSRLGTALAVSLTALLCWAPVALHAQETGAGDEAAAPPTEEVDASTADDGAETVGTTADDAEAAPAAEPEAAPAEAPAAEPEAAPAEEPEAAPATEPEAAPAAEPEADAAPAADTEPASDAAAEGDEAGEEEAMPETSVEEDNAVAEEFAVEVDRSEAAADKAEAEKDGAPSDKKEKKAKKRKFIKGNLVHVGTRQLVSRYDHIGVKVGPAVINKDIFLAVTPTAAWYNAFGVRGLHFAMHAPLNLLGLQAGAREFGGLKLRREDWDQASDYLRVIRFITFGRKESPIYFSINTLRPASIGHGMLMRNYQANMDVDRSMTGVLFDAYNEYGGFQLQANDLLGAISDNRIVSGLAFIKPLSFFMNGWMAESFSLGFEWASDFRAPRCLTRRVEEVGDDGMTRLVDKCMPGQGNIAQEDANDFPGPIITLPDDEKLPRVKHTSVHALGFSGELKVIKNAESDLKIYTTFHQFLVDEFDAPEGALDENGEPLESSASGGTDGFGVGFLGRFNIGEKWRSAFRIRGEYRTFGHRFQPSYFDSLYEIQKFEFQQAANDFEAPRTKFQRIFGDDAARFPRRDDARRHGFRLDFQWGLFKLHRGAKKIAIGFGFEDSTAVRDTRYYLHLEFPLLGFLQLFGTYMRFSEDGYDRFVQFDNTENMVVLTGLRLQILPILFLNVHYSRGYQIITSPGQNVYIGPQREVDFGNGPINYSPGRIFENVQTVFAEIEFGWEFDD